MPVEPDVAPQPGVDQPRSAAPLGPPRVWPGLLIVGLYWVVSFVPRWLDSRIFISFFTSVIACLLLSLAFWTWWFTNRTISLRDRLAAVVANVAGALAAGAFCHPSVGPVGLLLFGVPAVFTVWSIWMLVARHRPSAVRAAGLAGVLWLTWATTVLVRIEGVDGDTRAAVSWRWTPSAEQLYLASRKSIAAPLSARHAEPAAADSAGAAQHTVDPQPDLRQTLAVDPVSDWPGFRGWQRDGIVRGVALATDWNTSPPQPVWRQRVGPAWSSVVVIGSRLFTMEQRDSLEATICLDAGTGREIWSHEDRARFADGQAGAGPRSTPTFADNRLYTFGATGIVNCLDASSGQLVWTRNVSQDCDAPAPMWGFSSSPLVVGGRVIVYAGGTKEQALLAYDQQTGQRVWKATTGPISYSSAQAATLGGREQILFLSDQGLVSLEADSGEPLWQFAAPRDNIWRATQPCPVGDAQVLFGSEDLGLVMIDVRQTADRWQASQRWTSRGMHPAYNDFVVLGDYAYGFDGAIFCCVALSTGERRWKAGRYGHGQVLLLADQPLLLVLSESGEAVQLAVNPDRHEELGRFQAIQGKTWNHPVLAQGRLFVRNDEEMACYAPATASHR